MIRAIYGILTFAFGIFGTFAKVLGMTEASWFFIWGWFVIPTIILWIIDMGNKADRYMDRYDYRRNNRRW